MLLPWRRLVLETGLPIDVLKSEFQAWVERRPPALAWQVQADGEAVHLESYRCYASEGGEVRIVAKAKAMPAPTGSRLVVTVRCAAWSARDIVSSLGAVLFWTTGVFSGLAACVGAAASGNVVSFLCYVGVTAFFAFPLSLGFFGAGQMVCEATDDLRNALSHRFTATGNR